MVLLFFEELFGASTCERLSLVSSVVPDAILEQESLRLIEELSWGTPLTQRAIKRSVQRGLNDILDTRRNADACSWISHVR